MSDSENDFVPQHKITTSTDDADQIGRDEAQRAVSGLDINDRRLHESSRSKTIYIWVIAGLLTIIIILLVHVVRMERNLSVSTFSDDQNINSSSEEELVTVMTTSPTPLPMPQVTESTEDSLLADVYAFGYTYDDFDGIPGDNRTYLLGFKEDNKIVSLYEQNIGRIYDLGYANDQVYFAVGRYDAETGKNILEVHELNWRADHPKAKLLATTENFCAKFSCGVYGFSPDISLPRVMNNKLYFNSCAYRYPNVGPAELDAMDKQELRQALQCGTFQLDLAQSQLLTDAILYLADSDYTQEYLDRLEGRIDYTPEEMDSLYDRIIDRQGQPFSLENYVSPKSMPNLEGGVLLDAIRGSYKIIDFNYFNQILPIDES